MFKIKVNCKACAMAEDLEITTCSKCGGKGYTEIPWLDWLLWQLGKLLYPYVKEW